MTASTSTTPVIMNATEESRLRRVSPDEIDWMTTMPSTAANAEPRPPNRLAPPITAAAMALRFTPPAGALVRRAQSRRGEDAADGGEGRAEREHRDVDAVHPDAGASGGFDRSADGVDPAPPPGAGQHEVHDHDEREEEQEHDPDAPPQVQVPGGDQQEGEKRAAAQRDLPVALTDEARGGTQRARRVSVQA